MSPLPRHLVTGPLAAIPLLASLLVAGLLAPSVPLAAAEAPSADAGPDRGLYGRQDPVADDEAFSKFSVGAFPQSMVLLSLAAYDIEDPAGVAWLVRQQCDDGGWQRYRADIDAPCSADPDGGEDTNSTALAVQALVAHGETDPIPAALDYLVAAQNADGGFGYQPGSPSDPNSTALAVQALLAAGEDPTGGRWVEDGQSPYDALLGFQLGCAAPQGESGAFTAPQSEGAPNLLATVQAVPASAGVSYPVPTASSPPADSPDRCPRDPEPAAAARYAAGWLAGQVTDGGFLEDGFGKPSHSNTAYALLGLAATGTHADTRDALWAYLDTSAAVEAMVVDVNGLDRVAQLGLLAQAAAATGHDARAVGGRDLLTRLAGDQQGVDPDDHPVAVAEATDSQIPWEVVVPVAVGVVILALALVTVTTRRRRGASR